MTYFGKMVASAVLVASVLFSAPSRASGFIGSSKLVGYDIGDSGQLIFRVETSTGCSSPIIYVNRNDAWYSDMLAVVISSWNTGKPINVYVANCDANGYVHAVRMVQGSVF